MSDERNAPTTGSGASSAACVLLREALVNVANRTDGDGEPCWCGDGMRSGLFVNEHAKWCVNAREALRASA